MAPPPSAPPGLSQYGQRHMPQDLWTPPHSTSHAHFTATGAPLRETSSAHITGWATSTSRSVLFNSTEPTPLPQRMARPSRPPALWACHTPPETLATPTTSGLRTPDQPLNSLRGTYDVPWRLSWRYRVVVVSRLWTLGAEKSTQRGGAPRAARESSRNVK